MLKRLGSRRDSARLYPRRSEKGVKHRSDMKGAPVAKKSRGSHITTAKTEPEGVVGSLLRVGVLSD